MSPRTTKEPDFGEDMHRFTHLGPACIVSDHNRGSRDGGIARYDKTEACVKCVQALVSEPLRIDVHRIAPKYRSKFQDFWSQVDIQGPDQCWPWLGLKIKRHGVWDQSVYPVQRHWSPNGYFGAYRIATWFSWGDIGRLGLRRLCANNDCCNPLHLRVLGVPHYFHGRKIVTIDLEFSSTKLKERNAMGPPPAPLDKLARLRAEHRPELVTGKRLLD